MTIAPAAFFDRPAHRLSNAQLSLTIVPSLASRVMELIVEGDQNLFWLNEPLLGGKQIKGWQNWGGYKTWLAPQDRWKKNDLPDLQMDQSDWQVTGAADSAAASSLELRSPFIAWAGVVLSRRLTLRPGETKIYVRESMTNVSQKDQTWALWGVLQFPVSGYAMFSNDATQNMRKLQGKPHEFRAKKLKFDGDAKWKVGALTSEGWGSYQAKGWGGGLTVQFPVQPAQPHADNANLEAWSNSNPDYMELEWLSPLITLKPNETFAVETTWVLNS